MQNTTTRYTQVPELTKGAQTKIDLVAPLSKDKTFKGASSWLTVLLVIRKVAHTAMIEACACPSHIPIILVHCTRATHTQCHDSEYTHTTEADQGDEEQERERDPRGAHGED